MHLEDCFYLGRIGKRHGLKGEFSLILDVDNPNQYEQVDFVYVSDKEGLVPYIIEKISVRPNKVVAKFEDVNTPEALESLLNKPIYLPLEHLPTLEDNQYYFHDLVGYEIIDEKIGVLGRVTNVLEMPMQMLFEIDYKGTDILVPLNDEIVNNVNKLKKIVRVALPDGLLDVYLGSDKGDSNEN